MARLIDADVLLNTLERYVNPMPGKRGDGYLSGLATAMDEVEAAPTVDAEEVVRCKDCKYWENGKDYEPYCNHFGNMMTDTQADDFCS